MFACWMRLLEGIPHAILWLMDDNARTTEFLKAEAQKLGMSADRLVFTTRSAHSQYRAKLALSDVFLDSHPYNCGSTTRDVLNAGVPLVTLSGNTMVSRMGLSILSSMGLSHYCVDNRIDYRQRVYEISKLAQDERRALREKILSAKGRSSLSKEIETLIEDAYARFKTKTGDEAR
jgi:predicted O-linked N-acetylglucosamine transferase (SPINDLY family)